MFDFAWSEIALIGVVALIAIGPKDMPVAIKAMTDVMKKARRMAAEFQTHVDELVREADLHEVRDQFNEIRNFDLRGHVERTVDPDGALRSTFTASPFDGVQTPAQPVAAAPVPQEGAVDEAPAQAAPSLLPAAEAAPAFIPPGTAEAAPAADPVPPFIPPGTRRA